MLFCMQDVRPDNLFIIDKIMNFNLIINIIDNCIYIDLKY